MEQGRAVGLRVALAAVGVLSASAPAAAQELMRQWFGPGRGWVGAPLQAAGPGEVERLWIEPDADGALVDRSIQMRLQRAGAPLAESKAARCRNTSFSLTCSLADGSGSVRLYRWGCDLMGTVADESGKRSQRIRVTRDRPNSCRVLR